LGPAGGLGWWDGVLLRGGLAKIELEVGWQVWTMSFAVVGTACACVIIYATNIIRKINK
jgi:hypothetical protein